MTVRVCACMCNRSLDLASRGENQNWLEKIQSATSKEGMFYEKCNVFSLTQPPTIFRKFYQYFTLTDVLILMAVDLRCTCDTAKEQNSPCLPEVIRDMLCAVASSIGVAWCAIRRTFPAKRSTMRLRPSTPTCNRLVPLEPKKGTFPSGFVLGQSA